MPFVQLFGDRAASRRKHQRVMPPKRRQSTRLLLEQLEDRLVPATLFATPTTGIQAVVNEAQSGDTIIVAPGIYNEQVTINNLNNLTLEGSGQNFTFIQAPSTLTGSHAIVDINGSQGVTVEGFTIEGPSSTDNSGGSLFGVLVEGGGSATITQNHVTKIEDTPFDGVQEGMAIAVGSQSEGTTGSAIISHNLIDNYQKNGIVVYNTGSSAEITYNTVIGAGPTTVIAQNGIEINGGASAVVSYNDVSNNEYTPSPEATGILVYNNSTATITHNTLTNNDYDIAFYDEKVTPSDHVNFNTILASTLAGLDFEGDTPADSTGTLDASNNYWGSSTGPTHPNNPGGTGQVITDANSGGVSEGVVNFTPFLTTNTAVAVNNATLAVNAGNPMRLTATVTNLTGPDPVTTGTVTFTILQGSTPISSVTSGTVDNGTASAVVVLPAGTAPGKYTIQAVYNSGGLLTGSSGVGRLTVASVPISPPPVPTSPPPVPTPPSPPSLLQALFTLQLDGIEIVLDANGLGPVLGLPSIGSLINHIESTLPYAGLFGWPAVAAGANAAADELAGQ